MEILNLANYVISRCNDLNKEIDYVSLQNLLTLIQGYSLSEFNIPAFENEIKLGVNSSVIPVIFEKFKNERNKPLFISKDQKIIQPNYPFNSIFDLIIEAYENFSYLN